MKTYSKKKSDAYEDDEIVDLEEVCRLCMGKEEKLIPIFGAEEAVPLYFKIVACVSLEVFEGDNLPDKVCHACKYQLEKCYQFRKKCEISDLKLRHHIKNIRHSDEGTKNSDSQEEMDASMESTDSQTFSNVENSTMDQNSSEIMEQYDASSQEIESINNEADLMGITKVSYIQKDTETDEGPVAFTLPPDTASRDACTLRDDQMKIEVADAAEDMDNIFIIDNESQPLDEASMEAITNAVKETLASQPGININGQLQLKVNQIDGKSTQVEVTTDDGHVIVMEVMTEDALASNRRKLKPPSIAPSTLDNENDFEDRENDELKKVFQCPDCPKSFSRLIQLRRHTSVHNQQRGYTCGMCEKWFATRSALVRHERIHTGERPFQCELCAKSFTQKEILYRHLLTHTGEKPFTCPHCAKGFAQKEQLRVHIKTHLSNTASGVQLHYCSLCPKVFCHASGLSRHLVTHTGKTYPCKSCDKPFTDKSSLRRHILQANH